VIQNKLQDPIAEFLLSGYLLDGQRIEVRVNEGELAFACFDNEEISLT
jgi:ATP-dependent Clp protease ATP-binding subunit ClpA